MQSPDLPVALIVVVDSRLPAGRAKALQAGLLRWVTQRGAPTPWSRCVCAASCCRSCPPRAQRRREQTVLLWVLDACASPHALRRDRRRPPHSLDCGALLGRRLAAAIELDAQRSDHESDSKIRAQLAAEAGRDADACLALEPQAAACLYGRAVALGLKARAHPTRAGEFLSSMLDALARAESADPDYDEAGPARVRALVLIRAPGWPLGPGDPEAGLAAARRAVTLRPLYPPNLLPSWRV